MFARSFLAGALCIASAEAFATGPSLPLRTPVIRPSKSRSSQHDSGFLSCSVHFLDVPGLGVQKRRMWVSVSPCGLSRHLWFTSHG